MAGRGARPISESFRTSVQSGAVSDRPAVSVVMPCLDESEGVGVCVEKALASSALRRAGEHDWTTVASKLVFERLATSATPGRRAGTECA